MPFTPTHTLAALPIAWLWSRHGTFSALVIGTMVPDWPLYVPFGPTYDITHSVVGLFSACLPLGLALAIFYQLLLKRALFELMPDGLKVRVVHYVDTPSILDTKTLAAVAVAVLLGAASHIGWDEFTHRGAWGVRMIPALSDTAISRGGIDIPLYTVLQHGFTLAGFPLFLLIFVLWYRQEAVRELPQPCLSRLMTRLWRVVLIAVPAAYLSITGLRIVSAPSMQVIISLLVDGVTRAGFIILVLLACYALFFAMTNARTRTPASGNLMR